MHEKLWLDS